MKIIKIFVISFLILLGVAIPILGTDLYWMWIPFLSHTGEYPIKLSALFMAVSAFITLLLAFTAVRTIEESNKREQRNRQDNQTRENRDRQERLLKEIIEWATEILICARTLTYERLAVMVTTAASVSEDIVHMQEFNVLTWKGAYIRFVADRLDPIIALQVAETRKHLLRHVNVLDKVDKFIDRAAVGRHRSRLDDSARKLIEEAVILLTQDVKTNS